MRSYGTLDFFDAFAPLRERSTYSLNVDLWPSFRCDRPNDSHDKSRPTCMEKLLCGFSALQFAFWPVDHGKRQHAVSTALTKTSFDKKGRHLRQNSLTLNLHVRPQRQLLDRHARSRGFYIAPVRFVDVVHGREVLHVGEEDVDFEDGVEACAGGGEDRGEVADALVLWVRRVRSFGYVCECLPFMWTMWVALDEGSLRCGRRRYLGPSGRYGGRYRLRLSSIPCCWR